MAERGVESQEPDRAVIGGALEAVEARQIRIFPGIGQPQGGEAHPQRLKVFKLPLAWVVQVQVSAATGRRAGDGGQQGFGVFREVMPAADSEDLRSRSVLVGPVALHRTKTGED